MSAGQLGSASKPEFSAQEFRPLPGLQVLSAQSIELFSCVQVFVTEKVTARAHLLRCVECQETEGCIPKQMQVHGYTELAASSSAYGVVESVSGDLDTFGRSPQATMRATAVNGGAEHFKVTVQSPGDLVGEGILKLLLAFRLIGTEQNGPVPSGTNKMTAECEGREVSPAHRRNRQKSDDHTIAEGQCTFLAGTTSCLKLDFSFTHELVRERIEFMA